MCENGKNPPAEEKMTVRALLALRSRQYREKTFLIDPEGNREYTYAHFASMVNAASNLFYRAGIRKKDKVSILMSNSPAFLFAFFGLIQLGAVACPVNTHLKKEEVAYILDHSDSVALCTAASYLDISLRALHSPAKSKNAQMRLLFVWDKGDIVAVKDVWAGAPTGEKKIALTAEIELAQPVEAIPLKPDDLAELIYTSGTTGHPKGAMLTHHNLIVDARWITHWVGLGETERAMCVMPLFHVNGQIVTVMTPLYHGGSIVLPEKFSVTRFFPHIAQYGVTYAGTVATMLSMLLQRVDPANVPPGNRLKIAFCGSAPVPREVQVKFETTYRIPVIEGYGMTETTCRSTFNPVPPPALLKLGENDGYRKIGSVGRPLGNEMKVVDEHDQPLGANEIGEIVIRGENVTKGYYKDPETTAAAFKGGWFHSGDMGYYDEEGYFYIVDH